MYPIATSEAVVLGSSFEVPKQSTTFLEKAMLEGMGLFAAGCMAVHT